MTRLRDWRLLIALMLLAGFGCAGAPSGEDHGDPESTQMSIQEVRSAIDEAIGEASGVHIGQCRLLPLGARPCGGPRSYRAYSVAETDSAALAELAAVYKRLDEERNAEQGLVSTCEVLPEPDVVLRDGRCVTVP